MSTNDKTKEPAKGPVAKVAAPPEAPAPTLALTAADLKDIIASISVTVTTTVLEALKASGMGGVTGNLGETIGNAVAAGMAASTRRKITIGEYIARRRRENPLTLARPAWQNDKQVPETVLTQREIELLNQVHRSGRYINRLVQVIIGLDSGEETVYLRYHDKKPDQMFALSAAGVRNFETMLEMIVNAQRVEDDEESRDEEVTGRRRSGAREGGRSFGNRRETREAEEAAQVRRPVTAEI